MAPAEADDTFLTDLFACFFQLWRWRFVIPLGNKNPIAGLAMGFDKTFECKSEPNRHATQQQQIQI
jgi:hypothetical protein